MPSSARTFPARSVAWPAQRTPPRTDDLGQRRRLPHLHLDGRAVDAVERHVRLGFLNQGAFHFFAVLGRDECPVDGFQAREVAALANSGCQALAGGDADSRIYAFWDAVLNRTDKLVKMIRDTPLSVEEWKCQRQIYLKPNGHSRLRVGFAAFYLNRCNRSGIIGNAGLIGGLNQSGKWKIDARFNRADLVRRVERVARYRDRIELFNLDATELLRRQLPKPRRVDRAFVYLDPPYYTKGSQLYLNHDTTADHIAFATFLSNASFTWVMSYDNTPAIRKLYAPYRLVSFNLDYSAREWRIGKELLIIPPHVWFPTAWPNRIPDHFITSADRVRVPMPVKASALA